MPAGLEDQLAGVSLRTGVVAEKPLAVVEYHPSRGDDFPRDLRTGAASSRIPCVTHEASAMRSLSTQTLVAKKSLIMVV